MPQDSDSKTSMLPTMCSALRDQLSYALARIQELEEMLEECHDTNRRLRDGDLIEWDYLEEGTA
jgi:hypothetical protein